jgi:hypothetical protein
MVKPPSFSVADPHRDPAFHFDADPDPAFPLVSVLQIRIEILLFTLMRVRMRIQFSTLMRIRIRITA